MSSTYNIFTIAKISSDILYSYHYIESNFTDMWERQKAFDNWRLEIANYIKTEELEVLKLVSCKLKEKDPRVYLEFSYIFTEIYKLMDEKKINCKNNSLHRIINCIRNLKHKKTLKTLSNVGCLINKH